MNSDDSIQTLRGIACVLLVFYHVVGSSPSFGLRVTDGDLRSVNDALAVLRMPLFTVLSGYVYAMRPVAADGTGFLVGKARRLLVPMLVAGTALAIGQALVPGSNAAPVRWASLHLEPVGHLWFVEALFWVFALVLLLERSGTLHRPAAFGATWLAATTLCLVLPGTHWLGIEGALYLLPYFMAGLALRRFGAHAGLSRGRLALGAGFVAALALAQLGPPVPDPERRTLAMLAAGLSLCVLLVSLQPRSAALARLGSASYAIFLYHVFFTAAARQGLAALGVGSLALHCVAGLVAGLAGPWLLARLAACHPWSRLLMLGESPRRASRRVVLTEVRA